jgi:hypothetical protein
VPLEPLQNLWISKVDPVPHLVPTRFRYQLFVRHPVPELFWSEAVMANGVLSFAELGFVELHELVDIDFIGIRREEVVQFALEFGFGKKLIFFQLLQQLTVFELKFITIVFFGSLGFHAATLRPP